jgi:hypothetical protein
MLYVLELPIGKIQGFDKPSVYQYDLLGTSTVGFETLVSLSCVMVGYSGRVPIYQSQSRGKHSKESRTVTWVLYILQHLLVLLTGVKTHRRISYNIGN